MIGDTLKAKAIKLIDALLKSPREGDYARDDLIE